MEEIGYKRKMDEILSHDVLTEEKNVDIVLDDTTTGTVRAKVSNMCESGSTDDDLAVADADDGQQTSGQRRTCKRKQVVVDDDRDGDDAEEKIGKEEEANTQQQQQPLLLLKGESDIRAAWADTEQKNWQVNTQILYDLILNYSLEWPALSVQMLPGVAKTDSTTVKRRLLLGTHTSSVEQNHVILMEVNLPAKTIPDSEENLKKYTERGDYEGFSFGLSSYKFKTIKTMDHPGEVNRLRYQPSNPSIVATRTVNGSVLIYDCEKIECREGPVQTLTGHLTDGFALDWNPIVDSLLLSGSENCICTHDISSGYSEALTKTGCKNPVNETLWAPDNQNVFYSAGENGVVSLWDIRDINANKPSTEICKVSSAIDSLCISSIQPHLVLAGTHDSRILYMDIRNFNCSKPLYEILDAHAKSPINSLAASTKTINLCMSGGADHFVNVWDASKIGTDQPEDEDDDGPPELVFSHGGHTAAINEVAWDAEDHLPNLAVSVDNDNYLQIWQMRNNIFFEDESDREIDDDELE